MESRRSHSRGTQTGRRPRVGRAQPRLLAQAAIEGKVKLDDDVRRYLDGDYPNLEFHAHPIRLYDLVDHRSGLPFFIPDKPETAPDYAGDTIPWATRIANPTTRRTPRAFGWRMRS
jgi:CubicO group peptidase (beta-lactamase class C family)